MPINLASPGILVKEVDLTIGRVDSATDKNAAIVLTAEKGPVNIPVICESEQDLIDNFGKVLNVLMVILKLLSIILIMILYYQEC